MFLKIYSCVAKDQKQKAGGRNTGTDGLGKGGYFPLCGYWKSQANAK